MNTTKSPLTSLTIVPLVISLIIAVLGQVGVGVTDEETQIIIDCVAAVLAIVGRWKSKRSPVSLTAAPKLSDLKE